MDDRDAVRFEKARPELRISCRSKDDLDPSSTISCMTSSSWGYISGTLMPNGLSVACRHLRICSRRVSGCMEPAPSRPSPPALLTAEASRQPLHHTMPP